jgi:hypothetical protein
MTAKRLHPDEAFRCEPDAVLTASVARRPDEVVVIERFGDRLEIASSCGGTETLALIGRAPARIADLTYAD